MLLQYETRRLILKVLGPDYSSDVLRFYQEDRELFEKYEADRSPNFYTEAHQRNILHLEYGLTLKLNINNLTLLICYQHIVNLKI